VSRLAPIDEGVRPQATGSGEKGPVLRSRRRRPLHPEAVHDRLRERSAGQTATVGPTPYGWLVILYPEEGMKGCGGEGGRGSGGEGVQRFRKRIVRETSEDATYADACALLEQEMLLVGRCDAWIVAKRVPHQRTVRP